MPDLARYQRRYQQRYGKKTDGSGSRYLKRAQSNYLHFHAGNITGSAPAVLQDAKNQILKDFAFGMKKNSGQLNSGPLANMSFEEIKQWLQEWTSGDTGGIIGQEMGNAIAEKLQNDPYTGAGIIKGFNAAFANGSGYISTSGASLASQADYVMDLIWDYLDRYSEIFSNNGEDALLVKCLEIAHTGMNAGNSRAAEIWAKYNNKKISLEEQQTLSKKVQSNFTKMEEILENLQQIASMGKGGAGRGTIANSLSKGQKWNPKTLAKQLGSIFNAIGGEQVGEIVGATAAREVLQKGNKEIIQKATQLFVNSGAVVFSTSKTGEDTISLNGGLPIQQKGDWSIIAQQGNVTVVIPVSSKLYQGGASNGLNYTPVGQPFNGIIAAQSIGLDQLLAITLSGSIDWLEQHMAALTDGTMGFRADLGDEGTGGAYIIWQEFKEAAKYTGLFRALVGTGAQTKSGIDFAALLIVNSQVFSMADILQQFVLRPDLFSQGRGNGPDTIPDWPQVRHQVSGSFYGQWMQYIPIEHRLQTQYAAIRTLYGKKYNFEINIKMLT